LQHRSTEMPIWSRQWHGACRYSTWCFIAINYSDN
jgi:hypothetical protein